LNLRNLPIFEIRKVSRQNGGIVNAKKIREAGFKGSRKIFMKDHGDGDAIGAVVRTLMRRLVKTRKVGPRFHPCLEGTKKIGDKD